MRRGEFATMLVGAYELNFFARHKEDVNSQMRTFVSFAAYTQEVSIQAGKLLNIYILWETLLRNI